MVRNFLAGFRDPISRPRYIVWMVVAVLVIITVTIPVLGVSSSRWFCSTFCHSAQVDTITAYKRSSHSEIECYACHMPANANPVVFLLHKVEMLPSVYLVATNRFELPLNGEDEVALTMKATQCTQCHDEAKRNVTPSAGIKISHEAHARNGVNCTICHNRVAHKEDFALKLRHPATREPNRKHESFMKMAACFRCHSQDYEGTDKPPGSCPTCHPPKFRLKPPSHLEAGFFPKGHGKLGAAEDQRTLRGSKVSWLNGPATEETGEAGLEDVASEGKEHETLGESLPKVTSINYCSTCHHREFCIDCHGGVVMPHGPKWKDKHGRIGKQAPKACVKCHGRGTAACNSCHHGSQIGFEYNPRIPWRHQHPQAVNLIGAGGCLRKCHYPTFCPNCHVNGGVPPK